MKGLLLLISLSLSTASISITIEEDIQVYHRQQPQQHVKEPLMTFKTSSGFDLVCNEDGTYGLYVSGNLWLQSAPTFFHVNGKTYSTEDGSLKLSKTQRNAGSDRLGSWQSLEYWYDAGGVPVVTAFRGYDSGVQGLIFEQRFPEGASDTTVHNKDLISSGFPGFLIKETSKPLGYLAYGYIMVGDMGKTIGRWAPANFTIKDGRNSGPMALFDKSGDDCLFLSPFDQFMSTSALHDKKNQRYYWGLLGSVMNVPKGHSMKSVIYYGAGINDAIGGWGEMMRTYYNKLPHYRESDFTNNYLSYWSDNGAYYVNYYVHGGLIQNLTYEDAMLMVKTYADQLQIPYRSIQYSVWFKQGKAGGNGLWSGSPTLFPDGMKYMFEKTGLPATAHSRYWSSDTPYAIQNGGKYSFFVEKTEALPYDEQFWTDMFAESQQFGFLTYMQDWLNIQFDNMNATTNNVDVARTWLMQMGEGARKNDITIQYCMSESRHILQSLEIPVVTQARASDDYQPNDPVQWRIGTSSLFAHAVGLAPFKDTFWTTTYQPGNYYHGTEPFPLMHLIIAVLSTGPVGPGDMIGGTDAKMLMRCCATDGLILKPSRPALVVDDQLLQTAFGGDIGPSGELWATYSDIGKWRFGIIFATDMHNQYKIGPTEAHFGPNYPASKLYTSSSPPAVFDDSHPLTVDTSCSKAKPCVFYTTPVFKFRSTELLLLGELEKIVPISPNRVLNLRWDVNDFNIDLKGAARENVVFSYVFGGKRTDVLCVMSGAGTATVSIADNFCYTK